MILNCLQGMLNVFLQRILTCIFFIIYKYFIYLI